MTSRVEVSLCHFAEDALGSTGCGVGRCSRYLAESRLVLRAGQIYGLVKLSKKDALARRSQTRNSETAGELCSPSVTRVTPINSRSWPPSHLGLRTSIASDSTESSTFSRVSWGNFTSTDSHSQDAVLGVLKPI